ncbi:MAG: imidazolonepropionase [Longimicrobiales bacterium]|nr:imidazolonepropionase [Longimicrobiales bacterium]
MSAPDASATDADAPLLIRDARVITMADAGALPRASVWIEAGRIRAIEPAIEPPSGTRPRARVIEAAGRVLMPGFVDAHTHALWAGSRLDEFEARADGVSYLERLAAGGGILSTVRAVRAASRPRLVDRLRGRLDAVLRAGTTTIEVKSGYGLSTPAELTSLHAIAEAADTHPGTVVPTALLGHAVDPEVPDFFERTVHETLPAVSAAFPGIPIDAYCEEGAWPLDRCVELFEAARAAGHPFRVHADQFHPLGMTEWAADHGALSVDHLEASTPEGIARLARSDTRAVFLPACGLHLDDRYADARAFLDAGGSPERAVIATNFNPGSAPTISMPLVVALAVRKLGLGIDDALRACTVNAARLLGFEDRGTLEPGMRADCILLRHTDERMLAYELGGDPVELVVCGGRPIERSEPSAPRADA